MYQGPNETLKEWLASYNKEVTIIKNYSEKACLLGAISSMSIDIPFRSDLDAKLPWTWKEFLNKATKFINAEEAQILQNKRPMSVIIGNSEEESSDRKKRPVNNSSHESSKKRQKSGNDDKSLQLFKRFET